MPATRSLPPSALAPLVLAALLATPPAALSATPDGVPNERGGLVRLSVLSSKPELVSGGDALMRVHVPPGIDVARVRVQRNGVDVTVKFQPDGAGLTGLVDGLVPGGNSVVATVDGRVYDRLAVTNYPRSGPMISGPHEQPFYCATASFTTNLPPGTNLGAPLDPATCSVATRVHYLYRTTANTFAQLPDPMVRPANLAWTTTNAGQTVPYVVRLETGTINRAIYQTAVLHDPLTEPAPSPLVPPGGWNRKLIYPLGGGCQGGWYTQASSLVNPANDFYLRNGFGVASATLNTFGNNCNDLLSSETILMVKERFVEAYGPVKWTIGTGSSGGAYQSNHTADNYPGTFDGIVTTNSFPDVTTGMVGLGDARLLDIYFNTTRPGQYSVEQQKAISGFRQFNEITFLSDRTGTSGTSARRMDPRQVFPASVPVGVGLDARYHPVTNPVGARATVYDHTVNVYGRIPGTPGRGFAKRPLDNVGVQYGLKALNDGVISVDQFLDLNAMVGGFDIDLNHVPQRTVAYPDATARAYLSGRILGTGNGMASIPIITRHGYGDGVVSGDIHLKYWAFSIRERLIQANGHADNQVIVGQLVNVEGLIEQMNRWLDGIADDPSQRPAIDKVRRHKPADAVDACVLPDGTKIVETQTAFGPGACNTAFPTSMAPSLVAGSPLASDIIKCQLKPVDASDYRVAFSPAQWLALQQVFPAGVCDWSKPGAYQTRPLPWASVGPSPVNQVFDVTQP